MKQITIGDKKLDIKFTMGVLAHTELNKTQFTETIDKGGDKLFEVIRWMVYYGLPKSERPEKVESVDFTKDDYYEMNDHSMVLLHAYAEFLPKKMGDSLIASMEDAVEKAETIKTEIDEKN